MPDQERSGQTGETRVPYALISVMVTVAFVVLLLVMQGISGLLTD